MDHDAGFWILGNFQGEITDQWSLNFETDVRILDRFRLTRELILQPAVFFNINEHWTTTLQYAYVAKPLGTDEHRVIADGTYHTDIKNFVLGTRLRIAARFIRNVGPIARLRHRIHMLWSIMQTPAYLTVSNELFFNLNDQGAGPVLGFEEDRLFGGVGYHFGDHLRGELGYMWRPQRFRTLPTASDHIITVNLFFRSSAKDLKRPVPRETAIQSR